MWGPDTKGKNQSNLEKAQNSSLTCWTTSYSKTYLFSCLLCATLWLSQDIMMVQTLQVSSEAVSESVHSNIPVASEQLWVDKYAPNSFTELLSDEQTNREVIVLTFSIQSLFLKRQSLIISVGRCSYGWNNGILVYLDHKLEPQLMMFYFLWDDIPPLHSIKSSLMVKVTLARIEVPPWVANFPGSQMVSVKEMGV